MAPFFDLSGETALVTGGARGIGAGIARRLRRAGAKVAIFDLDGGFAAQVAAECEGIHTVGDMTVENDVDRAFTEAESKLGPVSILVNNAAITGRAEISWRLEADEVRRVFEVNVIGPFLCCKRVVPGMIERKYGRIVSIASIAGKEGNPTLLPYSASKAAVINMTKALAREVVGRGDITVNAISPAVIQTEMVEALPQATIDYMLSKIPMGRTGRIDEVASLVHYLASREASYCTGQCYDLSGGRATY
jgi:NAD(P)-dependent dehydrogenase (short-subunit alcohol dehydrogenase family)